MVEAAVAGIAGLVADRSEIDRGGVSWTVETLRALPSDVEPWLLLGADAVALLPSWREAEEVGRRAEVLAFVRPGAPRPSAPPGVRVRWTEGEGLDVSASAIRARRAAGLPVEGLVPPGVARILEARRLYR